jgi:hypothetical protein
MMVLLGRFQEPIYAAMRIVVGLLFVMNGAQKLFGSFGGKPVPIASMLGAAGIIEFTCGLLVLVGLLAGIAGSLRAAKWHLRISSFTILKAAGPFRASGQWSVASGQW